jgi:hypothetical protein
MKKIVTYFSIGLMALVLVGCAGTIPNYIIVATGTTVGFDVSMSPATQTPQATLAYKRAELALVPCSTNGQAPDVLMDFDFKTDLFSSTGGIHSRIATGEHATTQLPATMLMSKDSNGLYPTNFPTSIVNTNK